MFGSMCVFCSQELAATPLDLVDAMSKEVKTMAKQVLWVSFVVMLSLATEKR